jgi:hypothetical protein
MVPVYETTDGDAVTYTTESSDPERTAFYAYAAPNAAGTVPVRPVHRLSRDGATRLSTTELNGWSEQGVAFYVPCAGAPRDPSCTSSSGP